jgi:tetratricopeptide (TPR) repeat protein
MAAATIDSDGVVPMASVADAVGDVDDHAAATRVQEDDAERALREVIEAAQSDADVAEIAVSDTASFEEQHAVNEPAALLDSPLERETLVSAEAPVHAAMLTPAVVNAASLTPTPTLPIAAVAAEANVVATSRRDELRAATLRAPQDWVLRRRLAEALFEAGEREAGLNELHATLSGYSQRGQLADASDIADELVRISPERIQYHQKRVELAVRLSDQQRLRRAYLDLADTLVRSGDDARAHAVYVRVLEIDPWDERARTALGSAAPPPPPRPTPDDSVVSLADWLREDDAPVTTRMRMRAPEVSGNEQADFDALLRHFKEGVSRSLGEEDYESHYDLGVAYKEMGLLDDAIAEFQKALRSRRHRLPAYEALGQCFVEQSRHSVAATVLTRALHEPGLGDDHRIGVLYLLAYSCEALQRWDEARSYYSRVYATDINFRDVAARLAALDQIAR